MLKVEKKEERAQYNKKDTYTYEEVRPLIEAAMEDRARYLGFFYKVMPRDLFDKYAKKALYAYGEYKALGMGAGKGHEAILRVWPTSWSPATALPTPWLWATRSSRRPTSTPPSAWRASAPSVQGWEKMGLSPEEVEYLCDIASYGGLRPCNALDLQGTWLCTSAQKGCDYCDFKIEKLKEKTIV